MAASMKQSLTALLVANIFMCSGPEFTQSSFFISFSLCLAIVKKTSHLIVTTHNYTHYLPTLFVAFLWLTGPQSWAHMPPCSQEPISLPELLRSEQDSPGCSIELEAILTSRLLLSSMYLLKTSIVLHASPTF